MSCFDKVRLGWNRSVNLLTDLTLGLFKLKRPKSARQLLAFH